MHNISTKANELKIRFFYQTYYITVSKHLIINAIIPNPVIYMF
jgi:hypothetical protein